ncbi:methyltransferase domain-containing protein [Streptacidiphilus sp. ASG 303]|uniref:methyltransferase domain-containing protein n=1 Tax=Streptacidiphilus sp. ASG 303 TaxID=2896847 RepID=UPI001E47D98A|nr:methyltransferase domain-containing protein [Streptacidiphilus sp. ASG 303]MCD0481460.1 methyltransferase domain-containing protein [Streptacidiphilus sp. ASG 303]
MTSRAVYTHGFHASVLRSHTWRTAENSAGYLLPHLAPGAAVLDVGCGPGTVTADLAERVGPGGHVTGLDASAEVLEQARRTAAGRGLDGDRVRLAAGDVHALPFPDGSFDVVHAHQVLQHVADPVRALREMRRVCRPGGTVAARDSDYAAMAWYPASDALGAWLDLYRATAAANGGEPDAGRRLLSWAREAGFAEVAASASAWCYATPEERAWWGGLWAERTTSSAFARQAVAQGRTDEAELHRIADGWRAWGAADDGWFAVLHGEVLCRA